MHQLNTQADQQLQKEPMKLSYRFKALSRDDLEEEPELRREAAAA